MNQLYTELHNNPARLMARIDRLHTLLMDALPYVTDTAGARCGLALDIMDITSDPLADAVAGNDIPAALSPQQVLSAMEPEWKWLAMDNDGLWYVYTHMPSWDHDRGAWVTENCPGSLHDFLPTGICMEYNGEAVDSLTMRVPAAPTR